MIFDNEFENKNTSSGASIDRIEQELEDIGYFPTKQDRKSVV